MGKYVGKPIGVENLTWIPWEYNTTGSKWEYGTAVPLARAIEIKLSPQMINGLLESDNGVEDDISLMQSVEVDIHASQLSDAVRAALLGHTLDADGGMTVKSTDVAQKGALAFKALLSKQDGDDLYKYIVLYMGSFREFEETFRTMERSGVTFQTHQGLVGTFVPREEDRALYYSLRGDEAESTATTKITNWFTAPQEAVTGT